MLSIGYDLNWRRFQAYRQAQSEARASKPSKRGRSYVFQFRRQETGQETAEARAESEWLAEQQRKRLAKQQRTGAAEIILSVRDLWRSIRHGNAGGHRPRFRSNHCKSSALFLGYSLRGGASEKNIG